MTQTISVSCKLQVAPGLHQRIDATLSAFSDACNQILEVAQDSGVRNTTKLHHLTYYPVKASTGLKANHVCQAIRRVVAALKAHKQIHKFRPTSLSLDVRTFRFREESWDAGITLMDGRAWLPLNIGNYQRGLLKGRSPTSAVLVKRRNGDYYLQIQIDIPTQPPGKVPRVIGVDLGRRDVAHTSTGMSWDGGAVKAIRDRYFRVRRTLQPKRTRSSRKLLRRLSGKEARFRKSINHTISRRIVAQAKFLGAGIAIEDLTGIRKQAKVRGKGQRREHHGWSFHQLRQFLTYKAAIAGIPLAVVPPQYTSQTCHRCLHIGQRDRKRFKCGNCGWHGDADFNAANVIGLLGMAVTHPEVPGLYCLISDAPQGQKPTVLAVG